MTWLDAAIILVVLWFTYSAFQAGFIRETVTIVATVIGIVLAGIFYKDIADDVLVFVDSESLARIIAFAIIFGATALAGQMLAMALKPTVRMFQLGIVDNLAGGAFGFVKAMVIIQIFLFVFVTYPRWDLDDAIDDSFFGSLLIVDDVAFLARVLPDEFKLSLDNFSDRL